MNFRGNTLLYTATEGGTIICRAAAGEYSLKIRMNGIFAATDKGRRRVSGRDFGFGMTQRPGQRLGGGQDPVPGRHSACGGGSTALMKIIPASGMLINSKMCRGIKIWI